MGELSLSGPVARGRHERVFRIAKQPVPAVASGYGRASGEAGDRGRRKRDRAYFRHARTVLPGIARGACGSRLFGRSRRSGRDSLASPVEEARFRHRRRPERPYGRFRRRSAGLVPPRAVGARRKWPEKHGLVGTARAAAFRRGYRERHRFFAALLRPGASGSPSGPHSARAPRKNDGRGVPRPSRVPRVQADPPGKADARTPVRRRRRLPAHSGRRQQQAVRRHRGGRETAGAAALAPRSRSPDGGPGGLQNPRELQ